MGVKLCVSNKLHQNPGLQCFYTPVVLVPHSALTALDIAVLSICREGPGAPASRDMDEVLNVGETLRCWFGETGRLMENSEPFLPQYNIS